MITPRVISLDLDDTLWPVAPVIAAAEATLLEWLRVHHPRAVDGHDVKSMRALRASIAARFPEHGHDMTFLRRQALFEQFAAALPAANCAVSRSDEQAVDAAMEIFLGERNRVQFYEDVRPALLRLRVKYRLFAVSNGNSDLQRCGIGDLFDGHVTAAAAGAAKPDRRIFAHLVRVAQVLPCEILHVGDDPLADVVGAMQAGMQTAWLNRHGREWPSKFASPARTISTLAELC